MKRHFLLVFWLMTVSLDAMDIRVPSDLLVSLMGLNRHLPEQPDLQACLPQAGRMASIIMRDPSIENKVYAFTIKNNNNLLEIKAVVKSRKNCVSKGYREPHDNSELGKKFVTTKQPRICASKKI